MKALLILIGVILIILGIVAGMYTETAGIMTAVITTTPYESYMIPLIIAGVVLIIIGALIKRKHEK